MGATAWAPIMERLNPEQQSIYTCQYGVEKGPVLLRISGSHPGLADSISLSTELAQGRTSQKVKQAFQTALDQLFLALGVTAPRGLIDSITNEQRYLYHAPYGTLWFAKVHKQTAPKGETLWFRMRKRE